MKFSSYSALVTLLLGNSIVDAATHLNALNYNPKRQNGNAQPLMM